MVLLEHNEGITTQNVCDNPTTRPAPTIDFNLNKFEVNSTASVVVIDQCANKDPTKRESITITVNSDTDPRGIQLNLDEYRKNSPKFVDHPLALQLDSVKSDPSIAALQVSSGDTITASYNGIKTTAQVISPPMHPKPIGVARITTVGINNHGTLGTLRDDGIRPDLSAVLSCFDESNNDGICDEWKDWTGANPNYQGSGPGLAIPFGSVTYQLNCDTSKPNDCPGTDMKDLYVEIDYMKNGAISQRPSEQALDLVKSKLLAHNIRLHYIIDDNEAGQPADSGINFYSDTLTVPGRVTDSPSAQTFFGIKNGYFGDATDRSMGADWLTAKRQAFHYALFIHDQSGNLGSSGWAEIFGNDMVISLGEFSNGGIGSADEIAGTFMHELGHNLSLGHGGSPTDAISCKPNHLSVMSYQYQFPYTTFNPTTSTKILDYSSGNSIALNENGLVESSGVGSATPRSVVYGVTPLPLNSASPIGPSSLQSGPQTAGNGIDWDGVSTSGFLNTPIQAEINNIGIPECAENNLETLTDYNDWQHLNFELRNSAAFQNGATSSNNVTGEELSRADLDQLIFLKFGYNSTGLDLEKEFGPYGDMTKSR